MPCASIAPANNLYDSAPALESIRFENTASRFEYLMGYLTIAKELNALANVQHRQNPRASRSFREAASLAFRRYDEGRR